MAGGGPNLYEASSTNSAIQAGISSELHDFHHFSELRSEISENDDASSSEDIPGGVAESSRHEIAYVQCVPFLNIPNVVTKFCQYLDRLSENHTERTEQP